MWNLKPVFEFCLYILNSVVISTKWNSGVSFGILRGARSGRSFVGLRVSMARAEAPKLVKLTEYFSKRGNAMVPLSVPRVVRSKLPRQVYIVEDFAGILRNVWNKIIIRYGESRSKSTVYENKYGIFMNTRSTFSSFNIDVNRYEFKHEIILIYSFNYETRSFYKNSAATLITGFILSKPLLKQA